MQELKEIVQALLARPIDWSPLLQTQQIKDIREYHRFLVMKAITGDVDVAALQLSPSGRVDQVWHSHMLLPKHYAMVCGILLGSTDLFDHSVNTAHDPNRPRRYDHTLAFYQSIWGEPDPDWWPVRDYEEEKTARSFQIFVKGAADQKPLCLDCDPSKPLSYLFDAAMDRWGINCSEQWKFLHSGRTLDATKTAADYNIGKETTIHALRRLTGC